MDIRRKRSPRIFLAEDVHFCGTSLSTLAAELSCCFVVRDPSLDLCDALEDAGAPLDLLCVSLDPNPNAALAELRACRERASITSIPALAISDAPRHDLDLWKLRALGIIGLVATRSLPEHVRFRISQAVYSGIEGRKHARVACHFPVQVSANGESRIEYSVSLSVAGMGLSCSRELGPNTEVELCFALSTQPTDIVTLRARVIHVRPRQRQGVRYEIGVFFLDLSEREIRALAVEVDHLLVKNATFARPQREDGDSPVLSDKS
jgi:hypothetical protein